MRTKFVSVLLISLFILSLFYQVSLLTLYLNKDKNNNNAETTVIEKSNSKENVIYFDDFGTSMIKPKAIPEKPIKPTELEVPNANPVNFIDAKIVYPFRYPDKFEYDSEGLVINQTIYGGLSDVYVKDNKGLNNSIVLNDDWFRIITVFYIPVNYIGNVSVRLRSSFTFISASGNFYRTTSPYFYWYNASSDKVSVVNDYVIVRIDYYMRLISSVLNQDSGWYDTDYEINVTTMILQNNGSWLKYKQYYQYFSKDPYPARITGFASAWIEFDYVSVNNALSYSHIRVNHENEGDYVLHWFNLYVSVIGSEVYLYMPDEWTFYNSSPIVSFDDVSDKFTVTVSGWYTLYFKSLDVWNYPKYAESRISFFNSRGDFIDFNQFHTYATVSPTRLIQYAPDVNDPDLVAWFRFNEGTGTTTYDWKNNIAGIIYGGATWTTGYIGKALSFDGVDDYVEVSSSDFSLGTWSFTIEFWVKLNGDSQGYHVIYEKRGGAYSSNFKGINLYIDNNGYIRGGISDGDGTFVADSTILSATKLGKLTWYHIAVVYDRTNSQILLYINGRLDNIVDMSSITGDIEPNEPLHLGRDMKISSTTRILNGTLDEFKVYRKILTSEEIWWHYALVFYFDGYRDLMGREPTQSDGTITQGVFGYAYHLGTYQQLKYSVIDDSIYEALARGGTTLFQVKINDFISEGTWNKMVYIPYYRYEWHATLGYLYVWYKDKSQSVSYVSQAMLYKSDFGKWHLIGHSWAINNYVLTLVDGNTYQSSISSTGEEGYVLEGTYFTFNWGNAWDFDIDEFIILREPLSPDMMQNIYYMAKKYVGGYYTDESFKATWDIETDSPEDGYGYSEDFSDISDWVAGYDNNYYYNAYFSTDGDIVTLYAEYKSDGQLGLYYWRTNPFSSNIDLSKYPFIEIRWKAESNGTSYKVGLKAKITNGTVAYWIYIFSHDNAPFDWTVERLNVYEYAKKIDPSWTAFYIEYLYIITYEITDETKYIKVNVDWLRVYRIEGYNYYSDAAGNLNVGQNAWISSIGGILILHAKFDQAGSHEYNRINRYLGVPLDNLYLETRVKGDFVRLEVQLKDTDTGSTYWTSLIWEASISDWTVYRFNLDSYKSQGYDTLEYVMLEIADDGGLGVSGSGEYDAYFDYIRIGYLRETVQGVSWVPVLYPIYQHPLGMYVWFNVTDIWGNQLVYEAVNYSAYRDFILQVYSWKFYNNRDDRIVKIKLQQQNSGFYIEEFLMPYEVVEYLLYATTYTVDVTYYQFSNGTVTSVVGSSTYTINVGGIGAFILSGFVLSDIANMIQQTESNILDQIINLKLNLTWGLGNLTVNITLQINALGQDLDSLNTYVIQYFNFTLSNISEINNYLVQNFDVLFSRLDNMTNLIGQNFTLLFTNVSNIYNIMVQDFDSVFSKIDMLTNLVGQNFTIVMSNISYIINSIDANFASINSDLGAIIYNLNSNFSIIKTNLSTLYYDMNNNFVIIRTNITTLYYDVAHNLTLIQDNISLLFIDLKSNFTMLNDKINSMWLDLDNTILQINTTTMSYILNISNTLDIVNATIKDLWVDLDNKILLLNTTIGWFWGNITEDIIMLNSTINQTYIDIINEIILIGNNISSLETTVNTWFASINQTIFDLNVSITNWFGITNSNITKIYVDLKDNILMVNTTVGQLWFDMTSQFNALSSQLNQTYVSLAQKLNITNASISSLVIDLQNQLMLVNGSLGQLILDVNNSVLTLDTKIGELKVNISSQFAIIGNQITLLNRTVVLSIQDLNNNVTKMFYSTWDQLSSLESMLNAFFNRIIIDIYNPLTGLGIRSELFKIYVDGKRIITREYYTLVSSSNIVVKDFWDRIWYNKTIYFNKTTEVSIPIPVGKLIIYNELDSDIIINVTLTSDPNKNNITITILKHTAIVLELPLGDYYITIISYDYKKLTVNLRTLLVSVAIDKEGNEIRVTPSNALVVDESFWEKVKKQAPSWILQGFLFGLGTLVATLIFLVVWYPRKKRAEMKLGVGPISYSYTVKIEWKDIVIAALFAVIVILLFIMFM